MSTRAYNCKVTPEELSERLDAFMAYCEEQCIYPDAYLTRKHLDISEDDEWGWLQYATLTAGDDDSDAAKEVIRKKQELARLIKKLREFREHMSSEIVRQNPKLTGWEAFRVKQPKYGGWTDKQPTAAGSTEITIKLDALGGSDSGK